MMRTGLAFGRRWRATSGAKVPGACRKSCRILVVAPEIDDCRAWAAAVRVVLGLRGVRHEHRKTTRAGAVGALGALPTDGPGRGGAPQSCPVRACPVLGSCGRWTARDYGGRGGR